MFWNQSVSHSDRVPEIFFKKLILKKVSRRLKSMKNYPACNLNKDNCSVDFQTLSFNPKCGQLKINTGVNVLAL